MIQVDFLCLPLSLSLSFSFEKEDDEGADDPREGARERNCFSITAPAKTAARAKFMAATEVTQRERRSRAYLLSSLLFPGFREKCRGARYTRRCVVYNSKLSERFLSLSTRRVEKRHRCRVRRRIHNSFGELGE